MKHSYRQCASQFKVTTLLDEGSTSNKHWQLSNILSVLSLYCTIQCANSTKYFQLSSLKGRACDSGVSVTFTNHSYQMCHLVSADNFFSFVFFETGKPLFSRQKLVDRKQTVQQSLPCDLLTVLGTGPKILVCENQIKGSEWPTSAHIAANTLYFDAFRSNSMLHTGFQRKMTTSLIWSSSVER